MQYALLFFLLALFGCDQPPEFNKEELGQAEISQYDRGRTGLMLRRQQCRFSVELPDITLSYEVTEGTAERDALNKCLSMKKVMW